MEEMHGARYGERAWTSVPSPSVPLSLNVCVFMNPEAFFTLFCWVSMEAMLHRHDRLNHWPLVIEFSINKEEGVFFLRGRIGGLDAMSLFVSVI